MRVFENCETFVAALSGEPSSSEENVSAYREALRQVLEDSRIEEWELSSCGLFRKSLI